MSSDDQRSTSFVVTTTTTITPSQHSSSFELNPKYGKAICFGKKKGNLKKERFFFDPVDIKFESLNDFSPEKSPDLLRKLNKYTRCSDESTSSWAEFDQINEH